MILVYLGIKKMSLMYHVSDIKLQQNWNQLFWSHLLLFQSFHKLFIFANSWRFKIFKGQSSYMSACMLVEIQF